MPHGIAGSTAPACPKISWLSGTNPRIGTVLPFDEPAAAHFGQVRAELYRRGKPIGPYDMMIAGHARALGLILVTNNVREFEGVPVVRIENWAPGE